MSGADIKRDLILEMLVGALCAQTQKTEVAPPKLERMPESLEIRFALSAAPPHLRSNTTTYVLDPAKGYVMSHQGTMALAVSSFGAIGYCFRITVGRGQLPSTNHTERAWISRPVAAQQKAELIAEKSKEEQSGEHLHTSRLG